jgi:hypothetical protein
LTESRLKIASRLLPLPYAAMLARYLKVSPDRLRRLKTETEWGEEEAVEVNTAWLEVAISDDWMSAARLAMQDGQVVVAEMRVFPRERAPGASPLAGEWSAEVLGALAPSPPRGGITKDLLRRVPMGQGAQHFRELLRAYQGKAGSMGWLAQEMFERSFPGAGAVPERPRPERGTGRPDWFFAQLAADYCTAIERGSRRPVAELAARRRFPVARIRSMLHEARVRGLLTRNRRGVFGGALTSRAQEILKQRHKGTQGRKG